MPYLRFFQGGILPPPNRTESGHWIGGEKMRLLKTETGFKLENGGRSLELTKTDMAKIRARVAGLQALNSNVGHDNAYRQVLSEILTEGSHK